jgi:SPP1 gp7 family putative phage head morphogenesis protein
MKIAIKAEVTRNQSVIYIYNDGYREEWIGGHRNWRNRNPGNVIYNKIPWNGLIGHDSNFCIFSDAEYGKRATRKIIANRRSEGKNLVEAIMSYAPPHENNTEAYILFLEKISGVQRNLNLQLATDEQVEKIVQGIFIHEGTQVGTIKILEPIKPAKTGKYIWRTAQDEKVRKDHAERDGTVFDFANPPKGGNPSDDYNCRCWAEPIPETTLKEVFKK